MANALFGTAAAVARKVSGRLWLMPAPGLGALERDGGERRSNQENA